MTFCQEEGNATRKSKREKAENADEGLYNLITTMTSSTQPMMMGHLGGGKGKYQVIHL